MSAATTSNLSKGSNKAPKTVKVAVVQASPKMFDVAGTLDKLKELCKQAAAGGAQLVLFPEAFISCYPRGTTFGTIIGSRSAEGRELFRTYWESSVDVPGPVVDELGKISKTYAIHLVVGVVEREGGTLYCTVLFFNDHGEYLGKHRKLMPTAAERLVWGFGDGSTIQVFDTSLGKIGAVICWENYMPALRMSMYAKGVQIYLAPTADSRESWLSSMRHIAMEGRCFVLGCNQFIRKSDYPANFPSNYDEKPDEFVVCAGGSCIVNPLGQVLAGPNFEGEAILTAELDMDDIIRGKFDFDATGHYSRPDVFQLSVNESETKAVSFSAKSNDGKGAKKESLGNMEKPVVFVLSLVTANILISSIIAPLILFEAILNEYFLLPCISDVISTISSSVIFSAVFSTFLIAADRFYAVTSPLHYSMTITRSRSQIMIVLAWLSGIALALPYALLCTIQHRTELQRNLHILFITLQTAIGYVFPFVGLCWLYLRMYHAAHRNSERTRKHSISGVSGELLTVMDGSTSVIPQGIDFLTHYMNPFSRTPMAGSVQPVGNGHSDRSNSIVVPIVVKKTRRRSSNGSSSSLLFREEGRAIKTAFFVLASFFVCWTPHFALLLINEISESHQPLDHTLIYDNATLMEMNSSSEAGRGSEGEGGSGSNIISMEHNPAKFLGVFGMLLSSVLNPFIYVFRNKIACEEMTRLLYGLFGFKWFAKDDHVYREKERKHSDNGSGEANPVMNDSTNLYDNDGLPSSDSNDQPRYAPCIGKSPKRSSMKSLTPQSSINSTMTNCNSMNGAPTDSPIPNFAGRANESAHISFANGRPSKPPFMRSLTLPEQTQPRVKFPPNLTRQKSYASYRPQASGVSGAGVPVPSHHSSMPSSTEITPAIVKRAKFVRQDSVCSIISNDSVLMICSEDGTSMTEMGPLGILNLSMAPSQALANGRVVGSSVCNNTISRVPEGDNEEESSSPDHTCTEGNSMQGTPATKCYSRQDSNFSDASHRTNDSGIVLSSICSKHNDTGSNHTCTPEHCRSGRQLSPNNSPIKPTTLHNHNHCKRDVCSVVHVHPHHYHSAHGHRKNQNNSVANHQNNTVHETHKISTPIHHPMLLQTSI